MTNKFKESYDPTDDVFNRGLAVTMSLNDFITMVENKGITLSKHECMYLYRTDDAECHGRKCFGNVDSVAVQVLDTNTDIVIKSKNIKEVQSVIFSKNVLSADFVTDRNVLTIWWEL